MRLKNKKKYYISQYSTVEDDEGNSITDNKEMDSVKDVYFIRSVDNG